MEELRKPTKNYFHLVRVPTQIWTGRLANATFLFSCIDFFLGGGSCRMKFPLYCRPRGFHIVDIRGRQSYAKSLREELITLESNIAFALRLLCRWIGWEMFSNSKFSFLACCPYARTPARTHARAHARTHTLDFHSGSISKNLTHF